jgi:hypothetical protein
MLDIEPLRRSTVQKICILVPFAKGISEWEDSHRDVYSDVTNLL